MTTLAHKTILLTGASRGIGACVARQLAKQGATVVGVSRSPAELENLCVQVNTLGGKGLGIPFDIGQVEQLPLLLEQVTQQVGTVDILINNAGIELYRALPDYSLAEIQSILAVNLVAAIELTRLLLPSMLKRGRGHVVNMASLAGKTGHPYDSIYSASKAGLLMWNHAIRQELAGTGVRVSAICPGYVSGQGMLADTGIPAPSLAGTSRPETVALAVVKAIEQNQAEVLINQDPMTEFVTRSLLAIEQFFPRLGDVVNQRLGITRLNRLRIDHSLPQRLDRTGDRQSAKSAK
jgi:short-subunit dehydrogenase